MGRKCLATESPRLIVFVVAKLPGPQAGTLKHGQETGVKYVSSFGMFVSILTFCVSFLFVFLMKLMIEMRMRVHEKKSSCKYSLPIWRVYSDSKKIVSHKH